MRTWVLRLHPASGKFRFWLSYIAGIIGFGYLTIFGGYIWRSDYTVQLVGLVFAFFISFAWLIWRAVIHKDRFPRTGLEWPIGLGLLAILLSLIASPDPRQGLSRTACLVGYALLFYFFVSILNHPIDRWGLLSAAMTIVGLITAQALSETLNWYQVWFKTAGSFTLPPSPYRFNGILTSSIPTMGLINLFVPALLYTVYHIRQFIIRIFAGLWLIIFFLVMPFSSSRGAWLGLAIALSVGMIIWASRIHFWHRLRHLPRRKVWPLLLLALLTLAVGSWLAVQFLVFFGTHPSHGNNPFGDSGRMSFWSNAIEIWKTSPWFGAGPGRFGLAYLKLQHGIPPGFWPVHAHNLFFQVLAEFGLIGFIAWLILLVYLFVHGLRRYRQATVAEAPWVAAFLAGLAALLTQLCFDEFTTWVAVMSPAVFILAWIWTTPKVSAGYAHAPLIWISLPVVLLLTTSAWSLWGYQPLSSWKNSLSANSWRQSAELATESTRRDPNFHFYHVEAGLLWAWEWEDRKDPIALSNARMHLERAISLEDGPSWIWANLAVLDFAAGDTASAIMRMDQALVTSPGLPAYYLNRGYFHEQLGQAAAAASDYQKVLALDPFWADHPFWDLTSLRREMRDQFILSLENQKDPNTTSKQNLGLGAESLIELQKIASIYKSQAQEQTTPDNLKREKALVQDLEINRFYLDSGIYFFYDNMISNRTGISIQLVPGFLQLSGDDEQIDALKELSEVHKIQGNDELACRLDNLRQQLIYGYGLDTPKAVKTCIP